MRRTKSAEDRVRDLHSLLLQKTQDLDSALEVGRKLRREYHSTRQDAEGMLQVCPPPRHLLYLSWPLYVPSTTYTAMQRSVPSISLPSTSLPSISLPSISLSTERHRGACTCRLASV